LTGVVPVLLGVAPVLLGVVPLLLGSAVLAGLGVSPLLGVVPEALAVWAAA